MNTKARLLGLSLATLAFVSCTKDNDDVLVDNTPKYNVPETYTFDRNGATTVDYAGQTTRLMMLQEMGDYVKKQSTDGVVVDATKLVNMYKNTNTPFLLPELNAATDKQLRNKTAASKEFFVELQGGGTTVEQVAERQFFEDLLTSLTTAGNPAVNAAAGVAGTYTDKRFYATNGLEPIQVVLKGLMGSCFMDQVVNNYLSTSVLDEASNRVNNTNKVLVAGKNYTDMEHKWDEAYGYIYGAGGGKFWDSYINQVNADVDFNTIKAAINLAFRKGRAAIVNNDYDTRDAQIAVIKENLAKVAAVRAVYYLKAGKEKLTSGDNGIKAFHDLSEGYGFIKALRYTNKPGTKAPYMSKAEVDKILNDLIGGTNGLWDIDYLNAKIDGLANQIASKFGFTVAQAEKVN
ncbi:DUF4856 domain-containing protein [Flavobacterium sp.]|uniref:DUF4856 domain-containing protein n=1 Tax=Flavobacterium sp. TaxID=239 RepID=UPI003D10203E